LAGCAASVVAAVRTATARPTGLTVTTLGYSASTSTDGSQSVERGVAPVATSKATRAYSNVVDALWNVDCLIDNPTSAPATARPALSSAATSITAPSTASNN
jgi:hypothetical protein